MGLALQNSFASICLIVIGMRETVGRRQRLHKMQKTLIYIISSVLSSLQTHARPASEVRRKMSTESFLHTIHFFQSTVLSHFVGKTCKTPSLSSQPR